jgi:hypothetical protein
MAAHVQLMIANVVACQHYCTAAIATAAAAAVQATDTVAEAVVCTACGSVSGVIA